MARPNDAAKADLYLGIMTGTSLDAIDIAICHFEASSIGLAGFYSLPWPPALREILFSLATEREVSIDLLARTNFTLSTFYAKAVEGALQESSTERSRVRAIGLHGQTIRHLPKPAAVAPGLPEVRATLQWGSGSALAALTGIDVVHDFRSADVALSGQGAPLVPMFDLHFLASSTSDRLITNVGGISNVTWIPANASEADVLAFDCGPGNMMIDLAARRYFDVEYDPDGEHASRGAVNETLLGDLLSDPYFSELPPKSTGRERFGEAYLRTAYRLVDEEQLDAHDLLATLTEFTARSIASSLSLVRRTAQPLEIILSGGGAKNRFLMERIAANAPTAIVTTSEAFGIPVQAKEAIAFAFFAKAFLEDLPIHLPLTTGASRRAILGSLSKGQEPAR